MFGILTSLLSCLIGLMHASAPDDADAFCTHPSFTTVYASNTRILLDSYNYVNLLPPHDRAVWQQVDNDANNLKYGTGGTEWAQNRNTPCRQRVEVCGYSIGPQNNWLITQHIKRDVEHLTQVRIQIEYNGITCSTESCAKELEFWKREAPVLSFAEFRNTEGYQMVARVHYDDKQQNTTVNIDLSTDEDGFYLAIVDEGTCIEVTRVLVFYNVCPAGVESLANRSEILAPRMERASQPTQVAVECVAGATPENGESALLNCSQGGVWISIPGSGCICNPGLVASQNGQSCEALPDFTINFSSENCTSRVGCYTSLPANDMNISIHCNISYGKLSPSNHLPGSPIVLEVNSSYPIPIAGFQSIHYEVTANLSSTRTVTFNRVVNKTDGFPPRLMGLNNWLIGLGALFTSAAIIVCIIVSVVEQYSLRKNRYVASVSYWLPLVLWLLSVISVVVCIMVWIGMGYHINSQEDTCDSVWMSTRDSLVSLVFVFSLITLGSGVAAAIVVSFCFIKRRNQPDDNVFPTPPATPCNIITEIYDYPPIREISCNRVPSFIDIGENSVCGFGDDYWHHEGSQSDSRSYCQDVYSHQDYGSEHTHEDVYPGASPHNSRSVYI